MKHILLILLCSACLVQTMQAANDVPPVVQAGLDAYRTNGLQSAYGIWSKGTLENDKASRDMVLTGLNQVESAYGKMIGYDIVKTVPIGSVVKRVYLVVHYEKGPVFAYMDCYKAEEKWLVTDLFFHTKANLVFPPGLLGG
jgi:hypothetical protein